MSHRFLGGKLENCNGNKKNNAIRVLNKTWQAAFCTEHQVSGFWFHVSWRQDNKPRGHLEWNVSPGKA